MQELKVRIENLLYAISATETAFRHCSTPYLKDLYLQNIKYYREEILLAEMTLATYTNATSQDQ
jgi:hypothetical protein